MRRIEGWLFASGDPRRLAAVRVGLSALLAVRLSRPLYLGLAGQPAVLFRPRSFMHLFGAMPSRPVTLALQIVGVASAVLAAVGLRPRISLPVAWGCGLVLNGMATSVGKVVHNDVTLLLALAPLLLAQTGAAWSLDRVLSKPRADRPTAGSAYGWPVRTAMVVVAGAYFFSGFNKLVFSGPAWVTGPNLRWVLYTASDGRAHPVAAALFIADRAWLSHLVAAATIGIELGFPAAFIKPRLGWLFVPGAVGLHAAIWATMHLDYSAWAITAIVVFIPWPALADRLRSWRTRTARPVPV